MSFFKKKPKTPPLDINPNDKLNYNDFDLMDEMHMRFFRSFAVTLNVCDYVPQKYLEKAYKRIYKLQKKKYRTIGKTGKEYNVWFKVHLPQLLAERNAQREEDNE